MTNVLNGHRPPPPEARFDTPAGPHRGPVIGGHASRDASVLITRPSAFRGLGWTGRVTVGGVLLTAASLALLGLAATQGFVSWHQQYVFVLAAKHVRAVAGLEAVGLDAGAVIFALLAVAQARLGRSAHIERALNLACALGSMLMNVLGADLGSPRSVAVYILPPLLYAAGSDRLIATVLAASTNRPQRSAWRAVGRAGLYVLRFVLAPPSTARGARRAVLAAAPLPQITATVTPALTAAVTAPPKDRPVQTPADPLRSRYDALVASGDPRITGPVSALARDLAAELDMNPGTVRNRIAAFRREVSA